MADRAAEGTKRLDGVAVSGWSGGDGGVAGNGKRCVLRFVGILLSPFIYRKIQGWGYLLVGCSLLGALGVSYVRDATVNETPCSGPR